MCFGLRIFERAVNLIFTVCLLKSSEHDSNMSVFHVAHINLAFVFFTLGCTIKITFEVMFSVKLLMVTSDRCVLYVYIGIFLAMHSG